jgi:alginate O-acetyltransferase complex protein AlgI
MILRMVLYALVLIVGVLLVARVRSHTLRQAFLLIASLALYLTWGPWFLVVLLASILANYSFGKWMRRTPTLSVLWSGLAFNLALLSVFKYLPPLAANFSQGHALSRIALPLGMSFWTFQAMSYLLDLYRGEELDPTLTEFALYMSFFVVAISGPICRMPEMLPQFRSETTPSRVDRGRGLARIATGLLMMEVAQLLGKGIVSGQGINAGFDQMSSWSGLDVWCLAFGYGLQVFFNFAGYSHIAIGAAKMLGLTVPENFARPFTSLSPSIFWTRWHMSLSSWIRDYVFLPLTMMWRSTWWRKSCLFLSMVIFGIWHKGTLLFVLFGCFHGLLLVLHREIQQLERRFNIELEGRIWTSLSWLATFASISLGWIFFRSNSLGEAGRMFAALVSPSSYLRYTLHPSLFALVLTVGIIYAMTLIAIDQLDAYASRFSDQTAHSQVSLAAIAVNERWVWLAPICAAASILVLTLLPGQSRGANIFMYRFY